MRMRGLHDRSPLKNPLLQRRSPLKNQLKYPLLQRLSPLKIPLKNPLLHKSEAAAPTEVTLLENTLFQCRSPHGLNPLKNNLLDKPLAAENTPDQEDCQVSITSCPASRKPRCVSSATESAHSAGSGHHV